MIKYAKTTSALLALLICKRNQRFNQILFDVWRSHLGSFFEGTGSQEELPSRGESMLARKVQSAILGSLCSQIVPGVCVCAKTVALDLPLLLKAGVTHILECAGTRHSQQFPAIHYKTLGLVGEASSTHGHVAAYSLSSHCCLWRGGGHMHVNDTAC